MEHCEEISYARTGPVATISLNRPRARNAHTAGMADELADAFDRADRDEDVRDVVFTGEGKDFCVGADRLPADRGAAGERGRDGGCGVVPGTPRPELPRNRRARSAESPALGPAGCSHDPRDLIQRRPAGTAADWRIANNSIPTSQRIFTASAPFPDETVDPLKIRWCA
ncbi:enoyl-CoA hydratase/isomerase family protein [Saccharopolyspora sp. HNM0986]|nr:enoyl-CoA hydratase/isomerase family protein [Saccharopolyspora sp. HNM0986]